MAVTTTSTGFGALREKTVTELDVWLVGAILTVLFVGGMCLTAWWEDRRKL